MIFARALCLLGLSCLALSAVAETHESFTGSATCDGQDITFLITLTRHGGLEAFEFHDPCRSGSGPCNDMYKTLFDLTRRATGEAYLARPSANGLEVLAYRLAGTAVDILPDRWNRLKHAQHDYEFEGTPLGQDKDAPPTIGLQLLRYTDIHDLEKKVSFRLGSQDCETHDAIWNGWDDAAAVEAAP